MLEFEKHKRGANGNGNADAEIREQLKWREDAGVAPWQLYVGVIGVLFVVFGGTLAIVLGGVWYVDQRNGTATASILAGEL